MYTYRIQNMSWISRSPLRPHRTGEGCMHAYRLCTHIIFKICCGYLALHFGHTEQVKGACICIQVVYAYHIKICCGYLALHLGHTEQVKGACMHTGYVRISYQNMLWISRCPIGPHKTGEKKKRKEKTTQAAKHSLHQVRKRRHWPEVP